jgi:acyl-CoA thioesterase
MLIDSYKGDHAAELVGVVADEVREGYAKAHLQIQPEHLNGLGKTHGGIIFLLADTVFAYACNSRGVQTVAANCNISFNAPANLGDVLTAVAQEQYLSGRQGIYDVVVTNQDQVVVAHFRGNSIALKV